MRVIKCDLCKKKVKEKPVIAGKGILDWVELCEKCGAPVLRFLKKNKLISMDKSQKRLDTDSE